MQGVLRAAAVSVHAHARLQEGAGGGEMVLEVDWFQVGELKVQCVEQLREGLAGGGQHRRAAGASI